jgi:hypothetical protein
MIDVNDVDDDAPQHYNDITKKSCSNRAVATKEFFKGILSAAAEETPFRKIP